MDMEVDEACCDENEVERVITGPFGLELDKEKKTLLVERRVDVYRKSSIGKSLLEALEELRTANKIRASLAITVQEQFDRAMARHLPHVPNEIVFTAEKLTNYSLMADKWKLRLKNVTLSEVSHEIDHVDHCTIYASTPEEIWI